MATIFSSKWLVLGIDLITIAVSFVLAYIMRFNLNLNFDWSKLELQLPVVVLIALTVFLITGSYKEVLRNKVKQDMSHIFRAIFLFGVLIIPLILINHYWHMYAAFNIPLSIIVIYSFIAFVGLTGTHYVYRLVYGNHR